MKAMITLEQRASTLMAVFDIEKRLTPKKAHKLIVEAFQLLVEDCARIAEKEAEIIGQGHFGYSTATTIKSKIRALAAPTEGAAPTKPPTHPHEQP